MGSLFYSFGKFTKVIEVKPFHGPAAGVISSAYYIHVRSAYFSPSGNCLVTTSGEYSVRVYNDDNVVEMPILSNDNQLGTWVSNIRLTFWLSNTVVLRQIISQAFGNSDQSNPIARNIESNGSVKKTDMKNPLKWKTNSSSKQVKKLGFMQLDEDWPETSTFTAALKKIEFWIFSRIVESVWWQSFAQWAPPLGIYALAKIKQRRENLTDSLENAKVQATSFAQIGNPGSSTKDQDNEYYPAVGCKT
ncbi:hypothetical protein QJS10_CPB22g00416 [Acorus calamus]|uniref:Uncharacterized protein n=1 Tax=Acorus calamus TaxID=4465 RepID=A0AAV9BXC7_ACOCL|nr:hypothetical protein QJS10_CPB22g00416 [Acorus calamus]